VAIHLWFVIISIHGKCRQHDRKLLCRGLLAVFLTLILSPIPLHFLTIGNYPNGTKPSEATIFTGCTVITFFFNYLVQMAIFYLIDNTRLWLAHFQYVYGLLRDEV